jgi:hypothetical protein
VTVTPGCMVKMHGTLVGVGHFVSDPLNERKLKQVGEGTQALVISVKVLNDRDPMFTTMCILFSPEHGFFRVESTRFAVVWHPMQSGSVTR